MSNITTEYRANFSVGKITKREHKTRRHTEQTKSVLTKSIQENGIVEPILIDEDFNLIHGEYRLEIARELNFKTVPVLIVRGIPRNEGQAYHLMANRVPNWSTWNFPETDAILSELDGGLSTEIVLGFEAPSEKGHYRELAREIGWFIDIIPTNLSSSAVNLEKLASLLAHQLNSESGKYQFSDDQLLFMETMRQQLEAVRERMILEGEMTPEEAEAKIEKFSASKELHYLARLYADAEAAKQRKFENPWLFPFKGDASGKIMGLTQFIEFASQFRGLSSQEANDLFNSSTSKELEEFVDQVGYEHEDDNPYKDNRVSILDTLGIEMPRPRLSIVAKKLK